MMRKAKRVAHRHCRVDRDGITACRRARDRGQGPAEVEVSNFNKMLLDLMWLEIIFAIEWYLYGMDCQNMLLLLLHLHCSRNIYAP